MTKLESRVDTRYYEKHLFRNFWIWTGSGLEEAMFVVVNLARCRSQSVFSHATPPLHVRFRNDLTRIGLAVARKRDAPRIFWASKGNRTLFEGRRKREGRRGNYFNSSRSIARCNFLAFTLGQGEGKKGKKEGKSWSIRPDVLSRLLQRREWGGRGGHNLRENLCGVSLTPSSHV